jgi:glyceraldehyde-3-phosphate dehydrogenase (NADP+)
MTVSTPVSVTVQPMLLAGEPYAPANAQPLSVIYPADERTVVGQCLQISESDLPRVLQAAEEGFARHRVTTATQRSEMLARLAQLLTTHREELARLITLETGKPIRLATVEVNRAVTVCQGYANQLQWDAGQTFFIEGRAAKVRYFPLGPVMAVTPFNFPLNLVVHKLAPALAAGNSITIKPASKTPLIALRLGELAAAAGYQGVSVVPCKSAVAEQLVRSDVFKKLSFTGSSEIGWHLKAQAGKKVVTLELGGNAGCIIESVSEPTAETLAAVAKRCAQGGFWLSGQSCISVQRILVKRPLYEPFLNALVDAARSMRVGDPLDPETEIGTMIASQEVTRSLQWVSEAVSQGATLRLGGQGVSPTVMEPTILSDTRPEMRVNVEECFAPIVTVAPYDDFEEALAQVNQSPFGLQAGVYTTDRAQADRAYEVLEVGGVIINDVPTTRLDYLPYGGVKDSGLGREGVLTGVAEMSYIKTQISL